MNERIRQLAEQAGFMEAWFSESGDDCEREIKKFAELIVRECANVCRDQPNTYALKKDRDNCAIAVEQHFGVEE
jgi:hypothetical protein